ncbi:MAG: hypothetical protein ACFFAN_12185 [Promethearchaeota archaeon]
MFKEKDEKVVKCCVKNCQKKIPIENAIVIKEKIFCGECGVAFYRSALNL